MSDAPAGTGGDTDIRPVVRTASSGNRPVLIFGALAVVGAALLFNALNTRREALSDEQSLVVPANGAIVTAPPPLVLPPAFRDRQDDFSALDNASRLPPASSAPFPAPPPQVVTRYVERPVSPVPPAAPQFTFPQPSVVEAPTLRPPTSAQEQTGADNDRILAGHLRNPSLTVPQGAVIPAVLETALDSTRPGGVRAIVQRDVMGFDGTRILIPRGSRLYGEYGSDVSAGQKRALIRWTRLTRPDAVIVNLDSPAADPLGRAGVEGKVNSHFFARFGGAILQSVLDIGVGVATRSVSRDGVVVALPGSTQNLTGITQPQQIQPTLRVKQGTSVSVFVARDLDFSSVDR